VATRSYRQRDLESLYGLAGGRCSFPECRQQLVHWGDSPDSPVILGQIGHIVAHSDNGPRADPAMPMEERRRYNNLILVCPTHHGLVDKLDSIYTVAELRSYKATHERWVEECLTSAMDNVAPSELDVVCKAIDGSNRLRSTSLTAVPPEDKMRHNDLGPAADRYLKIGLMQSEAVADYLEKMASQLDAQFPARLRASFVEEYERLRVKGLNGDSLFLALANFAGGLPAPSFERFAAGLAVLSHLFQLCEVFEGLPS
jgi:hypothetical protein